MALALHEGRSFNGKEIVIERHDGSRRTVLAHANPLFDERGTVIAAVNVLVDITDRKLAELKLSEADEAKTEFLAMLAHELRNPLAAMQSAVELAARAGDDGCPTSCAGDARAPGAAPRPHRRRPRRHRAHHAPDARAAPGAPRARTDPRASRRDVPWRHRRGRPAPRGVNARGADRARRRPGSPGTAVREPARERVEVQRRRDHASGSRLSAREARSSSASATRASGSHRKPSPRSSTCSPAALRTGRTGSAWG